MRFTIFTGFYNYLDTFDELVESVFGQTHTDWEWIVADDFSENSVVSRRLDELCKDSRVKRAFPSFKKEFYWNPPSSQSDIYMVFDSDDIMCPKLLEAYDFNFRKFSDVQLISSNSVINEASAKGHLRSARHIHYGKNCNAYQSYSDKNYEYNWGDARAWRNNVQKFSEPHQWKYCAEDALKVTVCEEKGKILYLPRVLVKYAYREDSISHARQTDFTLFEEVDKIYEEANQRVDRKLLNSVHDHYDRAFEQTVPFYLSRLNEERASCTVELFSPSATPRDREILKDLYFDHTFSQTLHPMYMLARLVTQSDVNFLKQRLAAGLPTKQLVIAADKELRELTDEVLHALHRGWNWHIYAHYNAIVNF
jgi:glycosyltransferase involved in cell wall biosynthesis